MVWVACSPPLEGGGQAGVSTDEQERASGDSLVTPMLAITHLAGGVPLQTQGALEQGGHA